MYYLYFYGYLWIDLPWILHQGWRAIHATSAQLCIKWFVKTFETVMQSVPHFDISEQQTPSFQGRFNKPVPSFFLPRLNRVKQSCIRVTCQTSILSPIFVLKGHAICRPNFLLLARSFTTFIGLQIKYWSAAITAHFFSAKNYGLIVYWRYRFSSL